MNQYPHASQMHPNQAPQAPQTPPQPRNFILKCSIVPYTSGKKESAIRYRGRVVAHFQLPNEMGELVEHTSPGFECETESEAAAAQLCATFVESRAPRG